MSARKQSTRARITDAQGRGQMFAWAGLSLVLHFAVIIAVLYRFESAEPEMMAAGEPFELLFSRDGDGFGTGDSERGGLPKLERVAEAARPEASAEPQPEPIEGPATPPQTVAEAAEPLAARVPDLSPDPVLAAAPDRPETVAPDETLPSALSALTETQFVPAASPASLPLEPPPPVAAVQSSAPPAVAEATVAAAAPIIAAPASDLAPSAPQPQLALPSSVAPLAAVAPSPEPLALRSLSAAQPAPVPTPPAIGIAAPDFPSAAPSVPAIRLTDAPAPITPASPALVPAPGRAIAGIAPPTSLLPENPAGPTVAMTSPPPRIAAATPSPALSTPRVPSIVPEAPRVEPSRLVAPPAAASPAAQIAPPLSLAPASRPPAVTGAVPVPAPEVAPARPITPAEPVAPAVVAAAIAPPPASMGDPSEATRRGVDDALRSVECSSLSARISDSGEEVALSGYLPSEAVRRDLTKRLGSLSMVSRVRADAVAVVSPPHCGLLGQLVSIGAKASRSSAGEVLKLARNQMPRFVEDEALKVDMTAPGYPAYVYVDYYDSRGGVTHLLPGPGVVSRRFAPGQRYVVGQTGLEVEIAPPFGLDVIVTVASPQPLFSAPRPNWEPAERYLSELRAAIRQAFGDQAQAVEYDFRFVLTAPKARDSG